MLFSMEVVVTQVAVGVIFLAEAEDTSRAVEAIRRPAANEPALRILAARPIRQVLQDPLQARG